MIKPSPMIFNTFQVFKPDFFTFSTFRIQRDGIPKFKKALGLGLNSAKPVGIGIKFRTTLGCTLPYLASWGSVPAVLAGSGFFPYVPYDYEKTRLKLEK